MYKIITQEIVLNAEPDSVFQELCVWGESVWWPQQSVMQWTNLTGCIEEGTIYLQKVGLPFGPRWHTRVDKIDQETFFIKRVFLDGLFDGFETLNVIPLREHHQRVVYQFHYRVKGVFNTIVWRLFFKRVHKRNICGLLRWMKHYLEMEDVQRYKDGPR